MITISCEEYAALIKAEKTLELVKMIYTEFNPYDREKLLNKLLGDEDDE